MLLDRRRFQEVSCLQPTFRSLLMFLTLVDVGGMFNSVIDGVTLNLTEEGRSSWNYRNTQSE